MRRRSRSGIVLPFARYAPFLLQAIVACQLAAASPPETGPPAAPPGAIEAGESVSWQDVRAALGDGNCLLGERDRYAPVIGHPKECEAVYGPRPATSVTRVVDATLEDLNASFLLLGIAPEPNVLGEDSGTLDWPVAASRRHSEAVMANPRFQAVVERKVIEKLEDAGLTCRDCPQRSPLPKVTVSLDELMRYLAVMGWPDRVRLEKNPDGTESDRPRYSFHICTGLNGLSTLQDRRPELESVALVLAFAEMSVLQEKTSRYLLEAISSPGFKELRQVANQQDRFAQETEYLRRDVSAKLFADPALRDAIAGAVKRLDDEIGLELEAAGPG
jgi:hypothetical protein